MTLAIVTGGGSGIGREIARSLRREGYEVAVTVPPGAEAPGDDGIGVFTCDAADEAQVETLFTNLRETYGRTPSVVVNNAGRQTWAPLMDLSAKDWDEVIATNLRGTFLNTRIGARHMIAAGRQGAVINIGSGCNRLAFPKLVDYGASKGGIEQFTRSAALELGPHGIRVNCVAPGAIETDRTRSETPDYAGKWAEITPLRRIGLPEDVAEAVIFLASDRAGFITGQTLMVDGGVFSRAPWPDYG
ncbi:SDR family NAD(P)-dependent oxidoreductase [Marinibacterium profundimaris]|uniref:3-oxoacyl-ACP reductase n=1 Tax=Marinibacterium profundimaris TaxID=1679460 RepID=A0A225NS86_9RHOB|nr:SDR family NAD(P)-dependent oxidoreductase [Marinibacterium profundimaris]OWU77703.1 3-oxoacyl-ACP reductase [Marinibacterium profundimaris]